jgi:hypothetical protein
VKRVNGNGSDPFATHNLIGALKEFVVCLMADFFRVTAKHKPLLYVCIMPLELQAVLCTVSIMFLLSDVISTKTKVPVNQ